MTTALPKNAPSDCPGVQSERAGQSSACQGCPNQSLCASGQLKGPDPDLLLIQHRLASVKNIIVVLSGKGGVGKSTVASHLAYALSRDESVNVGLLDVDICGPSIPRIMGLEGEQVHQSGSGWSPVFVEENLSVMSVGFLLSTPQDAVIWRGPRKNGLIKQFLRDVDWSHLDYLVVDTPPGTSDEHLSITQYLKGTNLVGAVLVTTPQEVSLLDVKKEINFCQRVNIPILGIVENMFSFVCPKCRKESQIFPPSTGGADSLAREFCIPVLGKIPLDPSIGKSCDEGNIFVSDMPSMKSYKAITESILGTIAAKRNDMKSTGEIPETL